MKGHWWNPWRPLSRARGCKSVDFVPIRNTAVLTYRTDKISLSWVTGGFSVMTLTKTTSLPWGDVNSISMSPLLAADNVIWAWTCSKYLTCCTAWRHPSVFKTKIRLPWSLVGMRLKDETQKHHKPFVTRSFSYPYVQIPLGVGGDTTMVVSNSFPVFGQVDHR